MSECRLCSNQNDLVNIFDDKLKNSSQLKHFIALATGIEINDSDVVSKMVCRHCCNIVIKIYKYRTKAIANDKNLKERCDQNNSPLEKVTENVSFSSPEIVENDHILMQDDNSFKKHPSIEKLSIDYPNIILPLLVLNCNVDPIVKLQRIKTDSSSNKTAKRKLSNITIRKINTAPGEVENYVVIQKDKNLNPPLLQDNVIPEKKRNKISSNEVSKKKKIFYKTKITRSDYKKKKNESFVAESNFNSEAMLIKKKCDDLRAKKNIPVMYDQEKEFFTSYLGLIPKYSEKHDSEPTFAAKEGSLFMCEVCNQKCDTQQELNDHEKGHSKCRFCNSKMKNSEALLIHLKNICINNLKKNLPIVSLTPLDQDREIMKTYSYAILNSYANGLGSNDNEKSVDTEEVSMQMCNDNSTEKNTIPSELLSNRKEVSSENICEEISTNTESENVVLAEISCDKNINEEVIYETIITTNESVQLPLTQCEDTVSDTTNESVPVPLTQCEDTVSDTTNESVPVPLTQCEDTVSDTTNETVLAPLTQCENTVSDTTNETVLAPLTQCKDTVSDTTNETVPVPLTQCQDTVSDTINESVPVPLTQCQDTVSDTINKSVPVPLTQYEDTVSDKNVIYISEESETESIIEIPTVKESVSLIKPDIRYNKILLKIPRKRNIVTNLSLTPVDELNVEEVKKKYFDNMPLKNEECQTFLQKDSSVRYIGKKLISIENMAMDLLVYDIPVALHYGKSMKIKFDTSCRGKDGNKISFGWYNFLINDLKAKVQNNESKIDKTQTAVNSETVRVDRLPKIAPPETNTTISTIALLNRNYNSVQTTTVNLSSTANNELDINRQYVSPNIWTFNPKSTTNCSDTSLNCALSSQQFLTSTEFNSTR